MTDQFRIKIEASAFKIMTGFSLVIGGNPIPDIPENKHIWREWTKWKKRYGSVLLAMECAFDER